MSLLDDKMLSLRKELPQGGTTDTRSKADQELYKRLESSVAYGESDPATGVPDHDGEAYPQSETSPKDKALKTLPTARSTYWDFSEWEKRQPGYGKPKLPKPKEEGGTVGPGKEPTVLEQIAAYKKAVEENYSSDEVVGIGPDGKPQHQRGTSTGGEWPIEPPENIDGAADTAKDIYRESAKNYPKGAPEDVQAGFAVAASTHDYNNQGSTKGSTYANEEPLTSTVTQRDGRIGEDREMLDGSRFFVSADGKIILRLDDKDDK